MYVSVVKEVRLGGALIMKAGLAYAYSIEGHIRHEQHHTPLKFTISSLYNHEKNVLISSGKDLNVIRYVDANQVRRWGIPMRESIDTEPKVVQTASSDEILKFLILVDLASKNGYEILVPGNIETMDRSNLGYLYLESFNNFVNKAGIDSSNFYSELEHRVSEAKRDGSTMNRVLKAHVCTNLDVYGTVTGKVSSGLTPGVTHGTSELAAGATHKPKPEPNWEDYGESGIHNKTSMLGNKAMSDYIEKLPKNSIRTQIESENKRVYHGEGLRAAVEKAATVHKVKPGTKRISFSKVGVVKTVHIPSIRKAPKRTI